MQVFYDRSTKNQSFMRNYALKSSSKIKICRKILYFYPVIQFLANSELISYLDQD